MNHPRFAQMMIRVGILAATFSFFGCSDGMPAMGTGGTSTGGTGASNTGGTDTGGSATGGETGTGGSTSSIPSDTSEAGIDAFLAAETYKDAPWTAEPEVRPDPGGTSPHGSVRVFLNDTALAGIMAGKNDFNVGTDVGSMAVKELYDDQGTLVGKAAMLRTTTGAGLADWLYHCKSTNHGCFTEDEMAPSVHGQGASDCRFCHAGMFISPPALDAAPE